MVKSEKREKKEKKQRGTSEEPYEALGHMNLMLLKTLFLIITKKPWKF